MTQLLKEDSTKDIEQDHRSLEEGLFCPECETQLVPGDGCIICPFCGWSHCN